MTIWGWALLAKRPRLVEWHRLLMVQETERESWARYLTACRLNLEAPLMAPESRPVSDRIRSICDTATERQ